MPRQTKQKALETSASDLLMYLYARAQQGQPIDHDTVLLAHEANDTLGYSRPRLTARAKDTPDPPSLAQDTKTLEKLITNANNNPPLPARDTTALPRGSQPPSA